MKFRAGKRVRPRLFVDRMAAAVLHPHEFVLALVEFVIADEESSSPIIDSDSIVGSSWNIADNSGLAPIKSPAATKMLLGWPSRTAGPTRLRHLFDPAGRHRDRLRPVVGIGNPDAAGRRPQIAVEIVDRHNSYIDRVCVVTARERRRAQHAE